MFIFFCPFTLNFINFMLSSKLTSGLNLCTYLRVHDNYLKYFPEENKSTLFLYTCRSINTKKGRHKLTQTKQYAAI